jgi:hypothetical protein
LIVSRIRFSVLGLCVAHVACGEKFVAHTGADGGGASSGGNGANVSGAGAGGAREGGSGGLDDSAGAAGDGEAGEPGSDTGGVGGLASGGTGGLLTHPGGGSSGSAGSGGKFVEPLLPQDGLLVWLRADRGVREKEGGVQVWEDQSENKLNATQQSANARPKYLPTGFNGSPTLEFDGVGQFLAFTAGFGDFSKGLAGLIVAKPTKSDCASMLEFSNGSEIEDIAMGMFQDKWTYEVEAPFIQTGKVQLSVFSLYAANHVQTGMGQVRINGATLDTLGMTLPTLPTSGVRANNFVGHTLYGSNCEYFKGQLSEIILYSRALGTLELIAIEKYLDSHWSLSTQEVPVPTP